MFLTSVILASTFRSSHSPSQELLDLSRQFTVGEKLTYVTKASFVDEQRSGALQTFIPEDQDISYRHTLEIKKLKADGIAEVIYTRPTLTITLGDTGDRAAKTQVEQLDQKLFFEISPVNEILQAKDLNPPKPKKPGAASKSDGLRLRNFQGAAADNAAVGLLFEYISEIQRLAFFIAGPGDGLDVAPRTPFEEVKPGDTWKKTAGFTPQKVKGSGDKQAVQRLDYTYTFVGKEKNSEGKDVLRIDAKVKFENDVVEYAKQLVGNVRSTQIVKSCPIKFEASIKFEVDPKTKHMLKAVAESQGSCALTLKGVDQPILEDRFKGRTIVKLESWTKAKPVSAEAQKPTTTSKKKGG